MRLALIGMASEPHFRKWLPALSEQGVEVHLISYHALEQPIKGVTYHQVTPPFVSRTRFWSYHLSSVAPFKAILNEIHPDVLMGSFATHYGWIAARTGFSPLVLMTWTRDITVHPFQGLLQKYYRHIVSRIMSQANLVVTDGPALADLARKLFPEYAPKIQSLLWGIRLSDYISPLEDVKELRKKWGIPEGKMVLTSGRGVYFYYQPQVFLPAMLQLLGEREDVFVIVLTLGQERTPQTDLLLNQLAMHPRALVVQTRLPLEEVREIWAISDFMLSCPEYDGVSEAVLECLVAGAIPLLNEIPSNCKLLEIGVSAFMLKDQSVSSLSLGINQSLNT
ncbi:MAG TPA: hypothetical protein DIW24_05345, partial [Bacteroidetes bacterium]|nr:hypothetical protein [Bacteroidota bacterium]